MSGRRQVLADTTADALTDAVGLTTPLATLPLVLATAGLSVTLATAPGTAVLTTLLDVRDATLQAFRLVATANPGGAAATLQVRDETDTPVVLASLAIPPTGGVLAGAWTVPPRRPGGDRRLVLRAIGTGTVVVVAARLDARTERAPATA